MENITEKKIKIARTKTGTPCLWESYTEFDDLKRAIVIVNKDGKLKGTIFVRRSGSKQCLVPITEGDFIVKIFEDEHGNSVSLLKILNISNNSNQAELILEYRDANGNITGKLDDKFKDVIDITKRKIGDPSLLLAPSVDYSDNI